VNVEALVHSRVGITNGCPLATKPKINQLLESRKWFDDHTLLVGVALDLSALGAKNAASAGSESLIRFQVFRKTTSTLAASSCCCQILSCCKQVCQKERH